jgi:hypothetical protein
MPGVSMMRAPLGARTSSRRVVVWRALGVLFADLAGGQLGVAGEAVDETRVTDAGAADEGEGAAGRGVAAEEFQAPAGVAAGDDDGHAGGERSIWARTASGSSCRSACGAGAASGDALDALGVVVPVEAADEEYDVDVGGDDLSRLLAAVGLAGEATAAWEQGVELGAALGAGAGGDGDPIADGGEAVGARLAS